MNRRLSLVLAGLLLLAGPVAPPNATRAEAPPGHILLEVDREEFTLRARDLRDGSQGPAFDVVLGSPQHPTPAGDYPIYQVVHNPGWRPGPTARSRGGAEMTPSADGPMGVAKFPFAPGGFALHGGAHPLLLGKPISLGCIRALDSDLTQLIEWLGERGALRPSAIPTDRELPQALQVALRIRIR